MIFIQEGNTAALNLCTNNVEVPWIRFVLLSSESTTYKFLLACTTSTVI